MATRHDIIHIDFQANAGKANVALKALQQEADRARQKVEGLRTQLQNAKNANMPIADIQKLENELKLAVKEQKQWQSALNNNLKGVRALDEAVKAFNSGKGSVEGMNAALSKTALNAANLAKSRVKEGSKDWKEMDALAVALEQNIARCNTATNQLVATIKSGGTASKDTLTKAKSDLQQMIALEEQGSKAWVKYTSQLKTVEGALNKITLEEQRMAGQNALKQVFSGQYITKSTSDIEKLIAQVKQYQSTIADPEGKGARHFRATETALQKLSAQLGKTKGDIVTVQQALNVASAAGTANRFGAGLEQQGHKMAQAFRKTTDALNQLKQQRQTYTILQQNGISLTAQEQAMLAKLDAQIATTTARQDKLKAEMVKVSEANNLTTKGISQSIAILRQQQETVAAGSPAWQKYEAAIASLENRMKIMRGEAISLFDAMRLSQKAGGQGFTGTAKQLQLAEQAIQKAAAGAKKGSAEWQKYQTALAKIRVEMQNAGMTSERMRSILSKPVNAKNLNELQAAVKRAKAELDIMAGTVGRNSKAYTELAAQTKKAEVQLKQLQAQSHGTASAFDKAWSRLKTYVGLYMGAAIAIQKVVSTFGTIMELSDRMGEVRKTTGFTADEVGRLTTELKKLDTRTSLTSLMELSSIAGSIGLKTQQQVQGFTEAANMLTVALPEMGNEASRTFIKIADATGDLEKNGGRVKETLEKVGSTIIALRANSAAAAGPITDFVSRVGAVGAQAGISIDQIAALGATVDALGGRVEMSATALSRMIPAIKNNSFAVAQAIGITEKELKGMDGMQQMVAIFRRLHDSVKDFDMTTEEGMNAAADAVEQMMGKSTSMQEVMKTLNQQGARAGIVFGLLSQNVDMLEKQLGIAGEAYQKNTALMDEYNKMNDTTAAKWERLKNQLEEFFVGDQAQGMLGGIITMLRWVVNILTDGLGPALNWISVLMKTFLVYWGILKVGLGEGLFIKAAGGLNAMRLGLVNLVSDTQKAIKYSALLKRAHTEQARAAIEARMAQEGLNKAMIANVWTAVVVAVGALVYMTYNYINSLKEAGREAAKFQAELDKEQKKVDKLSSSIGETRVKMNDANKAVAEARKKLEEAKKATDGTTESAQKLKKAEEELAVAERNKKNLMADHKKLIEEFNTQYSKYLGFMLSEVATNKELAQARELVNDKLRETITLKRKEAALERIEKSEGEDRDKEYASLYDTVTARTFTKTSGGLRRDAELAATLMRDITDMAQKDYKDPKEFRAAILSMLTGGQYKGNVGDIGVIADDAMDYYKQVANIRKKNREIEEQFAAEDAVNRQHSQQNLKAQYDESRKTYEQLEKEYNEAKGDARKQAAANLLKQMDTINEMVATAERHFETDETKGYTMKDKSGKVVATEKGMFDQFVNATSENIEKMKKQREELLKVAGNLYQARKTLDGGTTSGGTGSTNPYGDYNKVTSPYSDWSGNDLVARRKEMLERVKALANGADVQAVLSEDAKFISEAVRKNIKTTEQAIEWYNQERLKIQDALHAKHLTNTGDWMDPEKVRKRFSRVVQDEMKYYLDELDAYYTERNQVIQQKRNDEEITEGEAWLQTIRNETEWYQRRAELQKLYADKSKEVTEQEQQAIFGIISERTGETVKYIKANVAQTVKLIDDVGQKSKETMKRIKGDIDLGTEKDQLKSAKAVGKSVKFMADTLAKERPLNGIVDDLQTTLAKMGILEGQVPEKMRVLIGEIENAYTTDVKGLVKRIKDAGFTEWARQIEGDTTMQQALMAQLRKAYEAVQEAIRKEASRIKKDADMMWKTILLPDGTSLKQATDEVLARMTQQQDSVGRANSLIGAGVASENVATKLAVRQLRLQMSIQQAQFALMRKIGNEKAQYLDQLAEELKLSGKLTEAERARKDAANVRKSLELAVTEETKKQQELSNQIAKEQEEAQNRLYTELREWGDLLASSLKDIFEASAAGNEDYYNELAKLNLTGKGGPGAGTYVVIDDAGTSDAKAHYEYLDERQALERQHEIEQDNARAEAWKKVWDDLNQKMSEQITDWLNAAAQNAALDANSEAVGANTSALNGLTGAITSLQGTITMQGAQQAARQTVGNTPNPTIERIGYEDVEPVTTTTTTTQTTTGEQTSPFLPGVTPGVSWVLPEDVVAAEQAQLDQRVQMQQDAIDKVQKVNEESFHKMQRTTQDTNKTMTANTQSSFAKMALAANLYGVAYQAVSNENLSATQKWEMIALQSVGNFAISSLTAVMSEAVAKGAVSEATVLGKLWSQLGWAAAPVFAVFTGLLGAAMGAATSAVSKSKSQIAQATGSSSASAGKLATGMLTYAEGNVNEFTDPASLTPGRQYNVDAADGRTYRARYMGTNPKTHITNGPEFHLAGEAGREMIIDAGTTRQITMNEGEIWHAIQTLSNGGRGYSRRRSAGHGGMRALAEGNVEEFEEMMGGDGIATNGTSGMSAEQMAAFQSSLDRNNELLERALTEGIRGVFDVHGPGGLVNTYDKAKKEAVRHGERYT